MRIYKVYNNNLVLAKGEGEEIIVMGRGLGFQKKSGDEIDTSLVEKTFVMQDNGMLNRGIGLRIHGNLPTIATRMIS